jgi:hypothetical protein
VMKGTHYFTDTTPATLFYVNIQLHSAHIINTNYS